MNQPATLVTLPDAGSRRGTRANFSRSGRQTFNDLINGANVFRAV